MKHRKLTHCSNCCEDANRPCRKKFTKKRLRAKRERLSGELIPTQKEMRAIELSLLDKQMQRAERRAQGAYDIAVFAKRLRSGSDWIKDRVYGGLIRRGI